MATGEKTKDTVRTVEQLQKENNIHDAVHAGTCIQMDWSRGKEVTGKEYLAAVKEFKKTAAEGKKHA